MLIGRKFVLLTHVLPDYISVNLLGYSACKIIRLVSVKPSNLLGKNTLQKHSSDSEHLRGKKKKSVRYVTKIAQRKQQEYININYDKI